MFVVRKIVEGIDENKEGEVGIGELLKEGIDNSLEKFDIKKIISKEFKNGIAELKMELRNKGYTINAKLYDRLNNFDGSTKSLEDFFAFVDNEQNIETETRRAIKDYFKNKVLTKVKSNLEGTVPESILALLDNFVETGEITAEQVKNVALSELSKKADEFVEDIQASAIEKRREVIKELEHESDTLVEHATLEFERANDKIDEKVNTVRQTVVGEVEETLASAAKAQSTLYYREIEDMVIDLLYPEYVENPDVFSLSNFKQSPRLMVTNGRIRKGDNIYEMAKELKIGGYSSAVMERIEQGTKVDEYRMPVNIMFNVEGKELTYDVYVREIDGIHVIGLKIKENIDKEFDTEENYRKAVLVFSKDVNSNGVLREEFGKIKEKASQMYGMSSNLKISSRGISMINFEVDKEIIRLDEMIKTKEDNQKVMQSGSVERLKGVYIVEGLDVQQSNFVEIDEQIKSEEIYKLDRVDKYYEINISNSKLDRDFVHKAVTVKKEQGATAIILDVTGSIELSSEENMQRLMVAITAIHSLGLKAVMKIDINKVKENIGEVFSKMYKLGFDGISIEAKEEKNVDKLIAVLEELKVASNKYAVDSKNTIQLKDEEMKERLKNSLGDRGYEGYNVVVITEIDSKGEAKVQEGKIKTALSNGYERGRKVGELGIEVRANNMSKMDILMSTKPENITAGQIIDAVKGAGLNIELIKHVEGILNDIKETETGSKKVLEALGFARGVLEAGLVEMYKEAFDFNEETYEMNSLSDREAMGIVLVKAYMTKSEIFSSKEALKGYVNKAEEILMEDVGEATFEQERVVMAGYVNGILREVEETGIIDNKQLDEKNLAISLAILNDSMNKLSFNRIVEDSKRRAKTSTNAIKNILSAA
jgi:hypothetical protein